MSNCAKNVIIRLREKTLLTRSLSWSAALYTLKYTLQKYTYVRNHINFICRNIENLIVELKRMIFTDNVISNTTKNSVEKD